jgi:hypothetical protein
VNFPNLKCDIKEMLAGSVSILMCAYLTRKLSFEKFVCGESVRDCRSDARLFLKTFGVRIIR